MSRSAGDSNCILRGPSESLAQGRCPINVCWMDHGSGQKHRCSRARPRHAATDKSIHNLVPQAQPTLTHVSLTFLLLVRHFAAWEFMRAKKVLRTREPLAEPPVKCPDGMGGRLLLRARVAEGPAASVPRFPHPTPSGWIPRKYSAQGQPFPLEVITVSVYITRAGKARRDLPSLHLSARQQRERGRISVAGQAWQLGRTGLSSSYTGSQETGTRR